MKSCSVIFRINIILRLLPSASLIFTTSPPYNNKTRTVYVKSLHTLSMLISNKIRAGIYVFETIKKRGFFFFIFFKRLRDALCYQQLGDKFKNNRRV